MKDLPPDPSMSAAEPVRNPSASPFRGDGEFLRGFRSGALAGIPFMVVVWPFGLLFGVVATAAGMDLTGIMVLTSFVIAGASQFVLIELISDGAPVIVAILAALAVNLRLAMYSASLAPYFTGTSSWVRAIAGYFVVDQVYGLALRRYQDRPEESRARRIGYYFGSGAPILPSWIAGTAVGALAGSAIPASLPIDFAPPLTFFALAAPMIRGVPNLCAAAVAVTAALLLAELPWSLGLLAASGLGMGTGAAVEIALARRAAARADAGGAAR
ncbi:Predicted branched-chain amino acid permease (azaleucine resistance) [Albimonas donghaensis]|uniref:Predicted branched-chain amino acid permease (Azaleucine resistance) n=1 Tax=Albimonas donghaensis TaxID=356660 RepID=A0A1H2Z6M5_9RHOB|nr:AzlC family ABC transporter permease [Albimonas donghaensis]SDX13133.1 Predicted branched-chain amino acid permease (azaleucine resistance) [Albimonas donghaensis]